MKPREAAKTVLKGAAYALLPVVAFRHVVATKESIGRIRVMAGRGKTAPRPEELSADERSRHELEEQGREIVLALEEHERFDYMAAQLGWTEETLVKKKRELARAHTIRLCLLIFSVIFTGGLAYLFGFRPVVFGSAAAMYLTASCVKTTCLYVQVDERALWSMPQVVKREGFWKQALWFLE